MRARLDYLWRVDREETARAHRRRQALDALEFERGRAEALRAQLEEIVAELEGARVDEAAFVLMPPEDVELVRHTLEPEGDGGEADEEEDWLGLGEDEDPAGEEHEELEREIVRLQKELGDSERRQQAWERYLEALEQSSVARVPPPAPPGDPG